MTKRVAWFTGEATVKGHFTPHKVYEIFNEDAGSFTTVDDTGGTRFCLKQGCAHIGHKDWVFADVVEHPVEQKTVEQEVKPLETMKRKGAVALLPEDSKFEIGQRVQVDRSGYVGYTTIIGYSYDYDEYATECDTYNGCSHDCDGLSKKKGFGLWITEECITATKKTKWSEWIPHTTDEQPVADDVIVKVKFSDGTKYKEEAGSWGWFKPKHDGDGAILAYKVKLKDLESQTTQEKSKQDIDWQENVLGVCPVPFDTKVTVSLKNGEVLEGTRFNWGNTPMKDREIVKWRLAD